MFTNQGVRWREFRSAFQCKAHCSPHKPEGINLRDFASIDFAHSRVLDGGLASELAQQGIDISGPLWSARALAEAPAAVLAVHRSYLEAGADILLTASYQASALGFVTTGLPPGEAVEAARVALQQSAALAVQARMQANRPKVLIAASLGPYGAALANGAEFHGQYGFATEAQQHAALARFHAERIAVLADTEADLLAFETLPSLAEALAIVEALQDWPAVGAWFSFTCRDAQQTAHGEPVRACAAMLDPVSQVLAVGINCTAPSLVTPLLQELRAGTRKPLIAYPNSGEAWDAEHRCWTGVADVGAYREQAASWFRAGAQLVGGCCRTGPAHIRAVRAVAGQH